MRPIRLVEVDLALPGAPAGLTALFVSDIHARTRGRLRAVGRLLEACPADLLLLGGDYVERLGLDGDLAAALGRGAFPLGRYAVWGNNDRRGRAVLRAALDRAGVRPLENDGLVLWKGGRAVAVAGVLDPHADRPDVGAALRGIPDDVATILLAHSPDVVLDPAATARPAAILAGHCHGGQITLPGLGALYAHARVGRRLAEGVHRVGEATLLVGRGIGASVLPLRTVPPEAHLVRFEPRPVGV